MTQRTNLFVQLAILTTLLWIVLFGIAHDYLWNTLWYSALAHILGGFWVGLFGIYFAQRHGQTLRTPYLIVFVLSVGVAWELFEVYIGATHFPADTIDTIGDLVMDIVGGTAAAPIVLPRVSR